jgi:lambda repressor-like predicted transcriptional regulator
MPMPPAEIKELLRERGITQRMIAGVAKVSQTQVHRVLHERDKSPRVREVIAKMLGMGRDDLWPRPVRHRTAA